MKRLYRMKSLVTLCLLLLVAVTTSCKKGEDYVNALPKDAAAVVSFDLKSMAQKSGLQGDDSEKALNKIADVLKSEMKGSEALIDKIVKDPTESGLKLTDKVYAFVESGGTNIGLLARVSSTKKLKKLITELAGEEGEEALKKGGGCSYFVIGSGIVAYTDKAFLCMANVKDGNGSDLIYTAQMRLRQKEADSYVATADFKELGKAEGDVTSIISLAVLPSEYTALVTMGMPSDINLSDVKALVTMAFDKGKINLDIKNCTTDKTILALQEKQKAASKKLKGTFLSRFNSNVFMWTGFGVNGKAYFEQLKANPTIKQMLESSMIPVDFEAIFSAMEGDVVLAMPSGPAESFIALAEVNNDTFLSTFEELKPIVAMTNGRMSLKNDGPKGYCFRSVDISMIGVTELYFGVKDNCFYITTNRGLIDQRPMGLTAADAPWGKNVSGKLGFIGLNIDGLSGQAAGHVSQAEQAVAGLHLFDYVAGGSEDGDNAHFDVVLKDKEHNVLEQLVGLIQ